MLSFLNKEEGEQSSCENMHISDDENSQRDIIGSDEGEDILDTDSSCDNLENENNA